MLDLSNKDFFILELALEEYNNLRSTNYNLDLLLLEDDDKMVLNVLKDAAKVYLAVAGELAVTSEGPDKTKYEFVYEGLIDIIRRLN